MVALSTDRTGIMAAMVRRPCLIIVTLLAAAAACRVVDAAAPEDPDVAVRVGDVSIARTAIDRVIRRLNPAALAVGEQRLQVEAAVVEQLVDEAILRLELSRQLVGIADSEIAAGMDRLKAQFVGKATTFEDFLARSGRDEPMLREQMALEIGLEKYVRQRLTPEAIEAAYATNRREVDGTRLRVSHVVLRPDIVSDDGLERRMKQADGIRRDILQGRMTFEEAARRYSAGPSRHRGGDLGWIGRDGPLIDGFAKPVFTIAKGDVSRPFITPFGIHIAKVTEIEPGRVGIGAARPRLEKMLAARLIRELVVEGRRATTVEYTPGVAHYDPATPADGPLPRRVVVEAAAEN
ncbi:MAG: peptidylprolyl isomerase [Planctomycetia bacterium]|nr:peptidylprolyl isomerase [Planctomycetia bacterium]